MSSPGAVIFALVALLIATYRSVRAQQRDLAAFAPGLARQNTKNDLETRIVSRTLRFSVVVFFSRFPIAVGTVVEMLHNQEPPLVSDTVASVVGFLQFSVVPLSGLLVSLVYALNNRALWRLLAEASAFRGRPGIVAPPQKLGPAPPVRAGTTDLWDSSPAVRDEALARLSSPPSLNRY
eukprot:gnl/Ergobibamus_cyprinoides/1871.p1 GENE.gnl/Ergobibamus_cyprinoides/1871~~gnl/Ergobibamus_cyprinoides/1871.p1  ORF type:complete len:179 (+),score=35.83 gnl/Ergobibamus_cyprinoides/1871:644-1180(+)